MPNFSIPKKNAVERAGMISGIIVLSGLLWLQPAWSDNSAAQLPNGWHVLTDKKLPGNGYRMVFGHPKPAVDMTLLVHSPLDDTKMQDLSRLLRAAPHRLSGQEYNQFSPVVFELMQLGNDHLIRDGAISGVKTEKHSGRNWISAKMVFVRMGENRRPSDPDCKLLYFTDSLKKTGIIVIFLSNTAKRADADNLYPLADYVLSNTAQ
jgi:hypothetical protein